MLFSPIEMAIYKNLYGVVKGVEEQVFILCIGNRIANALSFNTAHNGFGNSPEKD